MIKRVPKWIPFGDHLGLILGSIWGPFGIHFWIISGSILRSIGDTLDPRKVPQALRNKALFSKAQLGHGVVYDKTGPKKDPFWRPFGAHFGVHLGSIWNPFLDHFGLHSEIHWGYPGCSKSAPGLTKQSLFLQSTPWTRSGI